MRVGPNHVLFTDFETSRKMSSARSQYTKGPYYEGTRAMPGKDHLASITDEKKHSTLKRQLAPGVSPTWHVILCSQTLMVAISRVVLWSGERRLRALGK